jgi:hypothetical protein
LNGITSVVLIHDPHSGDTSIGSTQPAASLSCDLGMRIEPREQGF